MLSREEAGRPSKPGAHVQQRHSWLQSELRSEMLGCRLPADVELVNGCKVIWSDVIALAAHSLETGQNGGLQAPVVVSCDLLFERLHRALAAACAAPPLSAVVGSITRSTLVRCARRAHGSASHL